MTTTKPFLFLPELDAPLLDGLTRFDTIDTAGVSAGAIFDNEKIDLAQHRYALWRYGDPEKKPLVIIGLNPSTATHLILDNTVRRDLRYSRDLGFGGLVKLNLFSLRSTNPAAIYHHEPNIDTVTGGVTNDDYLKWFCNPVRAGLVLCAWGVHGALYDRGAKVEQMLRKEGVKLFALGLTKGGHPRHTLYMKASCKPQTFTSL